MKKINFKMKWNKVINKRAAGTISNVFVKKTLEINMCKIKKYCKVRDHRHYAGEYKGAANSISTFKNDI